MALRRKIYSVLFYWVPPFLWMLFIFSLSSNQSVSVTHTYLYDFLIFKTLHMIEYAILFFLVFRAFHSLRYSTELSSLLSVLWSVIFATTDEAHQLFVATRQGRIRDIFIDLAGIIIMYIVVKKYIKLFKRVL